MIRQPSGGLAWVEFAEDAILSLANAPAQLFLTKIDHFTAAKRHRFESGRGLRSYLKIVDVPVCPRSVS